MVRLYFKLITLMLTIVLVPMGHAQDVSVDTNAHLEGTCSGVFIRQELPHVTTVDTDPIRMFESNGAGLALGDLNADGLTDIVLANLDGPETVLWNRGDLMFDAAALDIPGRTRAAIIIDVDADGLRDIVFTSQRAAPSLWRNMGEESFEFAPLSGVSKPAYAMNWADLDADGDLDLVTGSYDAELARIMSNEFLFGENNGVFVYINEDGDYTAIRLSESAQALAILLTDLNGDNAPDIAVGNDFDELDGYWTLSGGTWETLDLFDAFTHSTMSFDIADINNDGSQELFATDMKPYNEDEDTLAAWGPIMEMMDGPTLEGDPQVMVNTLQTFTDDGYQNQSDLFGLEASGWSWSGKFGDLNSDGLEDLYVVNGMIAEDLFGHLPNNELVEENQAYINKGDDGFAPMPSWGLGATESGRGMSMADLDNDGDLDIVVNNLSSPALLFENQLCDGDNITVALQQPDSSNIHAIGARITLTTADATYTRDVIAASGYLSGDDATVHFGFPVETALQSMVVMWPDGMTTSVDAAAFSKNTHLTITRNPID